MALGQLLNQTVTVRNLDGDLDKHGRPSLSESSTIRARFERVNKTTVGANRELEPIHGVAFVAPSNAIDLGAKITYDSQEYRVIDRADVVGRNGQIHHYELMLQFWSWA